MTPGRRLRPRDPSTLGPDLIVFLGFVLLSALYTYPLFFLKELQIYGMQDDIVRTLNDFWGIGRHHDWLAVQRFRPELNAPEGLPLRATPQFFYWWAAAALSFLAGPYQPTNILVAVSFPLSAFFMYKLAFELTGCRVSSWLAGFLYAFSPWHQAKAEGFTEMASIQWLPLYAWRLLLYTRRPAFRQAVGVAASYILLFNFSYVIGFMATLFSVPFLLVWHLRRYRWQRGRAFPGWGVVAILAGGFGLAFAGVVWSRFHPGIASSASLDVFSRKPDVENLRMGSVGPIYFILPTYWHPIWGDAIREWMLQLKPKGWLLDDIVNPGYTVWILFAAGCFRLLRGRGPGDRGPWPLMAWLAAVSAILCLNPVAGDRVVPLPNALLYQWMPAFRYFSRFALMLTLFAILLAAWEWANRIRTLGRRERALATLGLFLVAGFELYRPMGLQVLDQRKIPEVYRWLRERPGDPIVAEYPLVTMNIPFEPSYLFWQIYHEKRLLNADRRDVEGIDFRRRVADYEAPGTVEALRERGVRYLLIHRYHYIAERFPGLNPRAGNVTYIIPRHLPGARLVAEWDDAGVYEIEGVR